LYSYFYLALPYELRFYPIDHSGSGNRLSAGSLLTAAAGTAFSRLVGTQKIALKSVKTPSISTPFLHRNIAFFTYFSII
jgi:hypothetical protein